MHLPFIQHLPCAGSLIYVMSLNPYKNLWDICYDSYSPYMETDPKKLNNLNQIFRVRNWWSWNWKQDLPHSMNVLWTIIFFSSQLIQPNSLDNPTLSTELCFVITLRYWGYFQAETQNAGSWIYVTVTTIFSAALTFIMFLCSFINA